MSSMVDNDSPFSRLTIYRQLMVADKETKTQIIFNIPEYDLQHPGTMAHVGMLYVYRSFGTFLHQPFNLCR